MPNRPPHTPKTSGEFKVEILDSEGLWKVLEASSTRSQKTAAIAGSTRGTGRFWISTLSLVGTVILHGLVVGGLLLGSAGRPITKRPFTEGASVASHSDSEVTTVLFFLNSHTITPPDWSPEEISLPSSEDLGNIKEDALLASIEPMPLLQGGGSESGTDSASSTEEAMGDGRGRALLFGRYMGQIKARIERAWMYPGAASTSGFDCRVLIKQDRRGEVKEVTLQRCDLDVSWQLSLVQAIQHASPLSGPPDDSVFSEIVTLAFSAERGGEGVGLPSPVDYPPQSEIQ